MSSNSPASSMDLAGTYDRIAKDWHEEHSTDDWWQEGTDEFIKRLSPGAHVLDVGCGSGVKSRYLLDHGLLVTGIDISKNLLEIARTVAPEGKFELCSMYDLDSLPDVYDAVFAQASLLHVPRKDAAGIVWKMADKVRPGGLVYLAVKEVKDGLPEEGVLKEDNYGYEYERFFSYFRLEELATYLEDAGMRIVWSDRKPSGKTTWVQIVGQKPA